MDTFHLASLPLTSLLPTPPHTSSYKQLLDTIENYADITVEKTILGSHTLLVHRPKYEGLDLKKTGIGN